MQEQRKIDNHNQQANTRDYAGILNKIRKGIAQRSADDDIRRIAAHGCGAAQVRAENL